MRTLTADDEFFASVAADLQPLLDVADGWNRTRELLLPRGTFTQMLVFLCFFVFEVRARTVLDRQRGEQTYGRARSVMRSIRTAA